MQLVLAVELIVFAVSLLLPVSVAASQNQIRGGILLEQGFDSNIERDASGEQSEWTTAISPKLVYTRSAPRNRLLLNYAPRVIYSHHTESSRMAHSVFAHGEIDVSPRLKVDFQEAFLDAEQQYADFDSPLGEIALADSRGKKRYRTNHFVVGSGYEYAENSLLDVRYRNQVLKNRGGGASDFVKQMPEVTLEHQISHQWGAELGYRFIKGDFDESEDLDSSVSCIGIFRQQTPFMRFAGQYGYSRTDYDVSADYTIHRISAGMEQRYSPACSLEVQGGISLLRRQEASDDETAFIRFALNRFWERGSWTLSAGSGFDEQQFSGTDDRGLSRYWEIGGRFSHAPGKNLSAAVRLTYREDSYIERFSGEDEREFRADVLLVRAFARWYRVSARYIFINRDADLRANRYDDHRFLLGLSAENDLMNW